MVGKIKAFKNAEIILKGEKDVTLTILKGDSSKSKHIFTIENNQLCLKSI